VARDKIRHTLKGYLFVICGEHMEDDVEGMVVGKFAGGIFSLRLLQWLRSGLRRAVLAASN
jgi:hypothetical protein